MDWNIQPRSRFCSVCQKKFVDKQTYSTILFDRGVDGYLRQDLCLECKAKILNETDRDEFDSQNNSRSEPVISQWQGVFRLPVPPKEETVQRDTVEVLLRKIVELNDPHYENAAYILAAMLERKRILKVKSVHQRDLRKITVYEHPKTGDIFTIMDPGLQITQLETVQREVCELLEKGLPVESEALLVERHSHLITPKVESDDIGLFDSTRKDI